MWLFEYFEKVDRRVIFLLVGLSLAVPITYGASLAPAPMKTADQFYETIENLEVKKSQFVLVAADFGPGTMAENRPQTMVAIEHLMRRRIPFAIISIYAQSEPFLREIPRTVASQLEEETGEKWVYGVDWVNFGYRPGFSFMVQGLAKADNLVEHLKTDANSVPLKELPMMKSVQDLRDVALFMEFTGLVGAFNLWLQYLNADGYTPPFLYGCTSITIPEAYIYFASGQVLGFFEGIAGAAWYESLLGNNFSARPNHETAIKVNTGLSYAQLVIIALIALGNLGVLVRMIVGSKTDGGQS